MTTPGDARSWAGVLPWALVGGVLALGALVLLLPFPARPMEPALNSSEQLAALLEQLHADHARLVEMGYSSQELRAAFQHTLPGMPAPPLGAPPPAQPAYHATAFARRALAALPARQLLACGWDASLPPQAPEAGGARVFLASNQFDSAAAMPNFILQLLRFAAASPRDAFYVSVYESGSKDTTPQWLELLALLLRALDVPHTLVAGGQLLRGEQDDRIGFLAGVRNAALAPLWGLQHAAAPAPSPARLHTRWAAALRRRVGGGGGLDEEGGSGEGSRSNSSMLLSGSASAAASFGLPSHVVFVNDVFFCAGDIARLIAGGADMMCGLDMWRVLGEQPWAQALLPLPLEFYDWWVARDVDGRRFSRYPPYVSHPASVARLRAGLPFPVTCCWNGLVALRAEPFLRGLHIRNATSSEECDASECSLLCEDFHRLG